MRAKVWTEEEYPVYSLERDDGGKGIEIPDTLFERYRAAEAEWRAVQDEIHLLATESWRARYGS